MVKLIEQALKNMPVECQSFTKDQWLQLYSMMLIQDVIENVKVWEKDSRNHISYMLKNHYQEK